MNKIRVLAPLAAALLALPSPAPAAAPKRCTRGGAVLLARSGDVLVVGIRHRPRNSETRRDEYLGCLASTGRRFRLFFSRDFGDDLREHDRFAFLEGRFLGVVREFEGGVSLSQTATTYDVVRRRVARTSRRCNSVDDGDFSGPQEVAFFGRGAIAYTCRRLWVTDAKRERQLEPDNTDVRQLAVSDGPFATRLYWTVYAGEVATVKSAELL